MRVTQNMIQDSLLTTLQSQRSRLNELQARVTTQKKVNKPSDNPVAASQILNQRTALDQTGQHLRSISQAKSQLSVAESAMNSSLNLLEQARSLAIAQSNGALSSDQRSIAANEVTAQRDQLLQLANTQFGGRYIFAGRKTDIVPFNIDGSGNVTYAGDDGSINLQIGQNTQVTTNSPGSRVFQSKLGTVDVFAELQTLITALNANDLPTIETQIDRIGNTLTQMNREISDVGVRNSFLDTMENTLTDTEINLQTVLSDTEDIDITKAISDLASQQSALEVSMAVATRILSLSVMNFIG